MAMVFVIFGVYHDKPSTFIIWQQAAWAFCVTFLRNTTDKYFFVFHERKKLNKPQDLFLGELSL